MGDDSKKRRIIGPSLPPGLERSSVKLYPADSSEAMDKTSSTIKPVRIFGPSHAPVEFEDVTSGDRDILSAKVTNCEMNRIERETWMTEIKHKFNESKIDPLNIKARSFIQRNRGEYTSFNEDAPVDKNIKAKELIMDEQIQKYNKTYRQKPLKEIYEEKHMDKKKAETESDLRDRIFDWERDMNSSVRQMSSKSANNLVSKSSLNDRFGSSSKRKYL